MRQQRQWAEQQSMQRAGLQERRAGAEFQAGQARVGLYGAKADVGPDLGMYAGLLQQAGTAPRGGGVVGGGWSPATRSAMASGGSTQAAPPGLSQAQRSAQAAQPAPAKKSPPSAVLQLKRLQAKLQPTWRG